MPKQPFQEELLTRLMDDGYTLNLVNIDFAKDFIYANHRFLPAELNYKSPLGLQDPKSRQRQF